MTCMKVESLVECLTDLKALPPLIQSNRPMPKKGHIETVEGFNDDGFLILAGFTFWSLEIIVVCVAFDPKFWREVQPPMDLSFIDELQSVSALPA